MRRLLGLAVLATAASYTPSAAAYPWMIHHGYTACAQCHVDPSGGGVMTDYGRAQGEILLRANYGKEPKNPEKVSSFLFGAITLPKPLELQADVRSLVIPDPDNVRFIVMQADARGAINVGPVTASGSIGAVSEGAESAWITSNTGDWNLVARDYWVGVNPVKGLNVRAGRMNLPFGIRTEDHILYVRDATRTNTNDDQQVGLAVSYGNKRMRGEVMGIAGNFQVSPDDFRKRGYSAYLAYNPSKTFEIGVSSLYTTSLLDVETGTPRTFMAEGLFTRAAPIPELAFMAEADVLLDDQDGTKTTGIAALGLADYEPIQGIHVQAIGQYCTRDFAASGEDAWSAGGGVQWFAYSRVDLRVDAGYGAIFCTPGGATESPFGLVQAHFYL